MGAWALPNNQKKRTSVDIFGQQYVIIGDEGQNHIRLVASMVDEKMREISSKNSNLDNSNLAVLTAVNAVNDYLKALEHIERLESELKRVKD